MTQLSQIELQHLYWRTGFGLSLSKSKQLAHKDKTEIIDHIFQQSRKYAPLIVIEEDEIPSKKNLRNAMRMQLKSVKDFFKLKGVELNNKWFERMAYSNSSLREKMTLFWHDHFACSELNPYLIQVQNNNLRKHALGNFRDMVHAMAKDAAMLKFLNNKQNKKDAPNENFARELLELFTIGIGHYTEKDIKSAARAFTGWNFDYRGRFELKERQHDYGQKTFMGERGNFNGEDIIDIVLSKRETAYHICRKIYAYFVNDQIDSKRVKELGDYFYENSYDIEALMKKILLSDWFYKPKNIGCKIKSPTELIVGLMQTFNIEFEDQMNLIFIQKKLGQLLFNPPNVAGWTGGRSWIDSSTLFFRMSLPFYIFDKAEIKYIDDSAMDNDEAMFKGGKMKRKINASLDFRPFENHFKRLRGNTSEAMTDFLLQNKKGLNPDFFKSNNFQSSSDTDIRTNCLQILSLPQYQLC